MMTRKEWEKQVGFNPEILLYTINTDKYARVYSFNYNDEKLNETNDSPFGLGATNNYPYNITLDPSQRFMYLSFTVGDYSFRGYSINYDYIEELNTSPFVSSMLSPRTIYVDSLSRFLYVTDSNVPGQIAGFQFDKTTGDLTELNSSPFGSTNDSYIYVVGDFSGKYLYATNQSSEIKKYNINQDGTLMETDTVSVPNNKIKAFLHPSGNYLYFSNANGLSNALTAFRIDKSNGNLSLINNYSPGPNYSLNDIISTSDGDYLFVLSSGEDLIYSYNINSDGSLANEKSFGAYNAPGCIAIDPTDEYLFVGGDQGPGNGSILIYRINNGNLTEIANSPVYESLYVIGMKIVRINIH